MIRRHAPIGAVALVALVAAATPAAAQDEGLAVAEEPTAGLDLGPVGIAGEHDGLASVLNPAGLHFLDGPEVDLAVGLDDDEVATAPGQGFGFYLAGAGGGRLLPRIGVGVALEVLRSARGDLAPNPGTPTRLTYALSLPLGGSLAVGTAWHHYFDRGPLGGVDTYDVGVAARIGAHLAAGAVLRDATGPTVGEHEVDPRYEIELAARPTADDRLELALGGRLAQREGDLETGEGADGWVRVSARVVRGIYLRAQVESRSQRLVAADPDAPAPAGAGDERRELRVAGGLEVSFGGLGVRSHATTTFADGGEGHLASGTAVLRFSSREVPGVQGRRPRIQRLELTEALDDRELVGVVTELRRLRRDPGLAALVIQVDGLGAGWASIDEIRRELLGLRAAGKRVYAYLVAGTTKQYYLASAADRVYVDPAGGVRLIGFASEVLYFKGLFDKLGIRAQFEKIEEFKSAPESFTMTGPSEPAARMRRELDDSLYGHLVTGIAAARRLTVARTRLLIDGGPYSAGDLSRLPDLVDAVATPEEIEALIAKDLGRRISVGPAPRDRLERWDYPTVAVIYVDGDIVDGKSQTIPLLGKRLVGGETIGEAIRGAADSPTIDAIVLRIDSPGGSALASDLMAREIFAARAKKPVICSMGDVAASGGYFVAAGCETIFAGPMTITGSIGIFTGIFDLSTLLGRLGLTWSVSARGAHADADTMLRPLTDDERARIKEKLHYFYGRFLSAVARGRGMSNDAVDAVGRGHVWTGAQAKPIRLVDRFGGIVDAIELAKARIGLGPHDDVRLVELPKLPQGLLGQLLGGDADGADGRAATAAAAAMLGPFAAMVREVFPASLWVGGDAPQARLPFGIVLPE